MAKTNETRRVTQTLWFLLLGVLVLGVLTISGADAAGESSEVNKRFNDYVIEVVKSYPTDGSHPYEWSDYPGITRDLYYQGELLVKGDPQKRSYCSGITFEVFFQAYQAYNKDHGLDTIGGLDLAGVEEFRKRWYGWGGDRRTIKHALESTGLGYQVTDKSLVEKGDFVQIWRHNGSGHTVVFIDWVRNKSTGEILGIRYWSSNSGKGLSYRTEYFGTAGRTIDDSETFFMKVIEPKEWWEKNAQAAN